MKSRTVLRLTVLWACVLIPAALASASTLDPLFDYDILGSLQEKIDVERLTVADIDNSGTPEILVVTTGKGGGQYTELKNTVYVFNLNGSLRWRYKTDREIFASIVKDINNDLNLETVVSSGVEKENIARGTIRILSSGGSPIREFSRTSLVREMAIDDMDGDRYQELLAGSEGKLTLLYIDGERIWDYPQGGNGTLQYDIRSVSTINLDSDDVKEVLFGAEAVYLLEKYGKLISKLEVDSYLDASKRQVNYLSPARLLKTERPQIIAATGTNTVYAIDISNLQASSTGGVTSHTGELKEMWTQGFYNKINALKLYDADDDGLDEILIANEDGNFYVLDSTGSVLWSFRMDGAAKDFCLTDIDGDGQTDIIIASSSGSVYSLGLGGNFQWRYDTNMPLEKLSAGDIDGDSTPEIAVTTSRPQLQVFKLNQSFVIKSRADNLYAQGERYFLSSSYTEAREALVKARNLYSTIGSDLDVNRVQAFIGRIDSKMSEERRRLADTYYERAQDYYISGNYEKSQSYVKMAKDIYSEFGDVDSVVKCELLELRINTISAQTSTPVLTTIAGNQSGFNSGGADFSMALSAGLLLLMGAAVVFFILKIRRDRALTEYAKKEETMGEEKLFSDIDKELGGLNEK